MTEAEIKDLFLELAREAMDQTELVIHFSNDPDIKENEGIFEPGDSDWDSRIIIYKQTVQRTDKQIITRADWKNRFLADLEVNRITFKDLIILSHELGHWVDWKKRGDRYCKYRKLCELRAWFNAAKLLHKTGKFTEWKLFWRWAGKALSSHFLPQFKLKRSASSPKEVNRKKAIEAGYTLTLNQLEVGKWYFWAQPTVTAIVTAVDAFQYLGDFRGTTTSFTKIHLESDYLFKEVL